jgi:RNA-directed DNA polymerase
VNFLPAVSDDASKAMSRELRSWRIDERSDKTLDDLARVFNKVVQGWINYSDASMSLRCIHCSDV